MRPCQARRLAGEPVAYRHRGVGVLRPAAGHLPGRADSPGGHGDAGPAGHEPPEGAPRPVARMLDLCAGTRLRGPGSRPRCCRLPGRCWRTSPTGHCACASGTSGGIQLTGRAVCPSGRRAAGPRPCPVGQFDVHGVQPALHSPPGTWRPWIPRSGILSRCWPWTAGRTAWIFTGALQSCGDRRCSPGGHLLYEVGIGQAEKVAWLLVKSWLREHPHHPGHWRHLIGWWRASGPRSGRFPTCSTRPWRRTCNNGREKEN